MATAKYRNETGGTIAIPTPAKRAHIEGAVESWSRIDADGVFDVEVADGVPTNSSLRVLASAKTGGIVPAGDPRRPKPTTRKSRIIE